MRKSFFWAPVLLLAGAVQFAGSAAADDDDDDILAPVEEAPAAPAAAPANSIGFVPLIAIGDAGKPLAEQVTTRLKKELNDSKLTISPLTIATGAKPSSGNSEASEKDLANATKQLAAGNKLLKQMKFGNAERVFRNAIGAFQKAAPAVTDVMPVIDAHIGLAEVYARQGMEDEAGEALADAARHNPEHVLDQKRYPPQFVRSHLKFRDRILKGDKGSIFVDETARGAEIKIGAKVVGTAPLHITDLPVGAHYVRLSLPGVGEHGALVEVSAGAEANVSGGFFASGGSSPDDALAQNGFDDVSVAAVAAAAKEAGFDAAIVGVVGKRRSTVPVALVLVSKDGGAKRLPALDFDGDLLNLSIEALKAREAALEALKAKSFGAVGADALLPDVKVGEVVIPTTTMRYEVSGAVVSDTPRTERTQRVASAEPDDDDENGRRILEGGQQGRNKSLRDGDEDRLTFKEPRKELVDSPDEGGLMSSPWLWAGVGTGAVIAVAILAGGGGFAGWYFLYPPTIAEVTVVLPE